MALGQLVVRLGLDATDFVQGMSRAEAESQRLARQMAKDLEGSIRAASVAFGVLAVAGIGAFKVISDAANSIAKFQDLAEITGDTAENFASLTRASDVSGVSLDNVAAASVKLTATLSKTDEEGAGAAQAIKNLGLNFNEFKNLAPADQLDAVAKAMKGFADGAEKTANAVALFGKSGAQLLPFLNDLADGSEKQITLTNEQIKAANDFSEALAGWQSQNKTLIQQMAADMLPMMSELLKYISNTGSETTVLSSIMGGLRTVFETVVILGSDVAFVFKGIGREIGGMAAQVVALATLDIKGFTAIGDAMKQDAANARSTLDKFQKDLIASGQKTTVKGLSDKDKDTSPVAKPKLSGIVSAAKKEPKAKAETNKTSEADRYLENLEKQIQKAQELTVVEKLRDDIAKGRIAGITKEHETKMLAAAIEIDTIKQYEDGIKKASENEIKANDARKKIAEENTKRLQDEATLIEGIRQSMLTDVQKLEEEQIKLNDLMQTVETVEQFEILKQKYDELGVKIVELKKPISEWEEAGKQAASSLVDGLADAIIQGKSLADVFKNVVKQLAVMILKAILFRAISGVVESFTGINISGAKAGGGNVNQNSTYMVGEKGPELFTPSQSGRITTNSNVMKDTGTGNDSGKTNVYNISAGGVSREEFTAGLNRTQAGAVSDVRQNRLRRRA